MTTKVENQKHYPSHKGRIYTERKVDKEGKEYQEFVSWEYSVKPKEEAEKVE